MKKTIATALATTALLGTAATTLATPGAAAARATTTHARGHTTTLQHDAERLRRYGAPGVLVGLDTPQEKIKVRAGYGNLAKRTPVPWNAKFRIGSFTKPFVSATVLQLVGEHRLSLDDTVDRWLPGMVRGHGNDGRKITVRELLQHTSGLPDYVAQLGYLFDREGFEKGRFTTVTARHAVALALRSKPLFSPGSSWSYSNTNYALAGMIIHRVTGHSWQSEVRRRIVEPLGLRHTSFPHTSPDIPRPHATGYERFPGPDATPEDPQYGEAIDATQQNPSWGGAAGEIISTVDDSNRFLQDLLQGRVLAPRQLKEMTSTVPTDAEFRGTWPGARYGLGLVWIPNSCGGSWAHGGDILGFMTRNGVSPDGSRSAVVSINTDSPKRRPGVPAPKTDITRDLIDHALCGTH